MKIIEPKAELIIQQDGLEGLYKQIEYCGRTCYKSSDKIAEGTAKPFVDRMIVSKHTAMLEHGTVYLKMPIQGILSQIEDHAEDYCKNKYSKVNCRLIKESEDDVIGIGYAFITTNLRVLIENNWLDDLQYICAPTEFHEKRYTFRLTTSIGITRELNRHRVNSIAEQSTRYCNYAKDKFGNEITFVKPHWLDSDKLIDSEAYDNAYEIFASACEEAEGYYMMLIENGFVQQQARELLPLCTASEICHTAFASDWRHFFDLRLFAKTGNPHPNMLLLAQKMKAEAEDKDVWNDIMRYHSKF